MLTVGKTTLPGVFSKISESRKSLEYSNNFEAEKDSISKRSHASARRKLFISYSQMHKQSSKKIAHPQKRIMAEVRSNEFDFIVQTHSNTL